MLHTGAAFARLGHRFTLHVTGFSQSRQAILQHYGLTPDSHINFLQIPRKGRDLLASTELIKAISQSPITNDLQVLMPRGDAGIYVLPMLELIRNANPENRPMLVYEMHNLQSLRIAEESAGRSLQHEEILDPKALKLHKKEGRLIALADGVAGLTREVVKEAESTYGPLPPHVILHSGTEIPEDGKQYGLPEYDVVYAGKLEERKGVYDLVRAMSYLEGKTLAVAGGPDHAAESIRQLVAQLGLGSRISIKGLLPPASVPGFLAKGRVGVCPLKCGVDSVSDRFSSPMKLLQMMAMGMPIVAADTKPVRELVTHAQEAHLVIPNSPAALAEGIGHLLSHTEYCKHLSSKAQRRAQRYSWNQRAKSLEAFFKVLAGLRSDTDAR